MSEIRVLLVSASPLARAGMEGLLREIPEARLVGAGGLADAAALAGQLLPDTALLDVGAGEPEDLDAIARLSAAQPGLPIVALGGQASAAAHALGFGASSLLPASVDPPTLRAALLAAISGLVAIPRQDLALVLPAEPEEVERDAVAPVESLTARELEVLQLMARGLTNRQIGQRLKISEHTVKFHAASVLGKLSARSRAEAVARAIGLGWILV
jgi:DNA-binding NarL/FixJ family response regulator